MGNGSGWNVDVGTCSPAQLVELCHQLRGSQYQSQLREAQKELIRRVRDRGYSDQEIVNLLILSLPKEGRKSLANEWAAAMDITEEKFKSLADA